MDGLLVYTLLALANGVLYPLVFPNKKTEILPEMNKNPYSQLEKATCDDAI